MKVLWRPQNTRDQVPSAHLSPRYAAGRRDLLQSAGEHFTGKLFGPNAKTVFCCNVTVTFKLFQLTCFCVAFLRGIVTDVNENLRTFGTRTTRAEVCSMQVIPGTGKGGCSLRGNLVLLWYSDTRGVLIGRRWGREGSSYLSGNIRSAITMAWYP